MNLHDLIHDLTDEPIPSCSISGLALDSRKIKSGELFIAYPGATQDGRHYIQQALNNGCSAVIYDPCDGFSPDVSPGIPCLPIKYLSQQLAVIASRFYQEPGQQLSIIGVTGTNGKTSIAYQLAQGHTLAGNPTAYIGTLGQGDVNDLHHLENTTPDALCLQQLLHDYHLQGIKWVCMEVSSHALSQHRVDKIPFNQAIYTNLSHDHLDYHHTMDNYASAKAQLFAWPGLEYAIVNQDDEYASTMLASASKGTKILSYGIHQKADVKVISWTMDQTGSQLELASPWGNKQLKLNALGEFNIYNGLAVFCSLMSSGYPFEQVSEIMAQLKPAPGRLEMVWQDPLIIVDYAHTPDALKNVLKTLNQIKRGKVWVVFGCGGDRDKTKRAVMGKVANDYADQIMITSDNPRTEDPETILDEIAEGIPDHSFLREADRKKAIEYVIHQADKDDIIIIAGKGHEDYQIIGKTKYPFSDQQVVLNSM